ISGGGFDSVTNQHAIPKRIVAANKLRRRPTEILHIGDYDKYGEDIYTALAENVIKFAEQIDGSAVTFTRLAVTPAQIKRYRLPMKPPTKDQREFGRTCQAEALPPDILADILRTAITDRLDERAYKRVLADERKTRRTVLARLG